MPILSLSSGWNLYLQFQILQQLVHQDSGPEKGLEKSPYPKPETCRVLDEIYGRANKRHTINTTQNAIAIITHSFSPSNLKISCPLDVEHIPGRPLNLLCQVQSLFGRPTAKEITVCSGATLVRQDDESPQDLGELIRVISVKYI